MKTIVERSILLIIVVIAAIPIGATAQRPLCRRSQRRTHGRRGRVLARLAAPVADGVNANQDEKFTLSRSRSPPMLIARRRFVATATTAAGHLFTRRIGSLRGIS